MESDRFETFSVFQIPLQLTLLDLLKFQILSIIQGMTKYLCGEF